MPTVATLQNNSTTTNSSMPHHQTMVADTTTPIGGPDLPEIVFTSTITRLPQLSTTTKLPQLSNPTKLPQLSTTKLPQLSTTKLATPYPVITSKISTAPTARLNSFQPNLSSVLQTTKLPSMPQQITRLPSMPYTNQDKFDVDALLANFQPINGQVIVSVPSSSNLPLDSPLVSSTTPDFFQDSPNLVLNESIMWCGGNMPAVVSDPPQTVPYNFDANDLIPICGDVDYDFTNSSGAMFLESQSILTGGPGSEKQLSFSML